MSPGGRGGGRERRIAKHVCEHEHLEGSLGQVKKRLLHNHSPDVYGRARISEYAADYFPSIPRPHEQNGSLVFPSLLVCVLRFSVCILCAGLCCQAPNMFAATNVASAASDAPWPILYTHLLAGCEGVQRDSADAAGFRRCSSSDAPDLRRTVRDSMV